MVTPSRSTPVLVDALRAKIEELQESMKYRAETIGMAPKWCLMKWIEQLDRLLGEIPTGWQDRKKEKQMNAFLTEWNDAVNCATEWAPDSPEGRWMARVSAAGTRLAKDYVKLAENLDRESRLAVALRNKLHDVAGPDVASSVNVS